jgi:hypothetical protein
MENQQEKPWIMRSILLAFVVLVFFLNLGILLFPLNGTYFQYSLFSLANLTSAGADRYFPFALVVLFYLSIAMIGLSILDLVRKTFWGDFVAIFYLVAESLALIAFQAVTQMLSVSSLVLTVLCLVLLAVALGLLLYAKSREKADSETEEAAPKTEIPSKTHLNVLLAFDIGGYLFLLLAMLFIPLYRYTAPNGTVICAFGNLLFGQINSLENGIYFLINLLLFIGVSYFFIDTIQSFFTAKNGFAKKSKGFWGALLFLALEFFLMGFIIEFVYALKGATSESLSFIPFLVLSLLSLPFALVYGRARGNITPETKAKKPHSLHESTPLLFAILVTIVSLVSLGVNVVDIRFDYSSGTYSNTILVNGLRLLQNYPSLGEGYQSLAFVMITMFVISGSLLLLTLTGYLARAKAYPSLAKASVYFNTIFMTLFGISGFYFTIATDITKESTTKLIEYYYPSYSATYTYKMSTQTFYLMIADLVLLIVMLSLKALEMKKLPEPEDKETPKEETPKEEAKPIEPTPETPLEEETTVKDPCPAFSEIDGKIPVFQEDLSARKAQSEPTPSLPGLVHFVVTYARNSRLHLSYSEEDIACFLAGLGACRLSILQGLSGTGKTSLPKIFSEAIEGNCELVEVESSWKDKNELLGYYNEFSEKFTPKKFTQALYKAVLNPEIVTFIVLDEMNLSRIEYYFSDFLSLMENEEGKRFLKLLNVPLYQETPEGKKPYAALEDGETIKVPSNIYFIGTANRDESTFVISDKVYDRAHTMNFMKRAPKVKDYKDPLTPRFYSYDVLAQLFAEAKKGAHFDIESQNDVKKVEELLAPYNITFGNRILNQMEDFVVLYDACFPERDATKEALESILLSKVVSKLETKTIDDKDSLVEAFTQLGYLQCADFVKKLNED